MSQNKPLQVRYLGRVNLELSNEFLIEHNILREGIWEPFVVQLFDLLVQDGDTCIDIGANTGVHSLLLARCVGETGKVISFEPSPDYSARFRRQIALNPDLAERISLHCVGISDAAGTLKLFESGAIAGNAYLAEEYDERLWNRFGPDRYIECRVETLDSVADWEKVDLIKIDVEGMEAQVAAGAKQLLDIHVPYLIYETLVDCFPEKKLRAMEHIVQEAGYFTFYFQPKDNKLVQCNYPHLPEDVVAIHPRRMLRIASEIHNRAIFEFNGSATQAAFGGAMRLTVIGVDDHHFCVAFHSINDDYTEMQKVRTDSGELLFRQKSAMGDTTFRVPIVQYRDGAIATYRGTVLFGYTDQERFVDEGRLIDGGLYLRRYITSTGSR